MTAKFNLTVSAVRFGKVVTAHVHATLPDACHDAQVTDIYPGGNIAYVVDPGEAQIFLRFTRRAGPCAEVVREWEAVRQLPDSEHKELVAIAEFEGRKFSVRAPIHDFELAPGADIDPGFNPQAAGRYIVIALTGSQDSERCFGCRVVSEHAIFPAIYHRVHGPASRLDCEIWRLANCVGIGAAAEMAGGELDGGG